MPQATLQTHNSHIDGITMYIRTKVVPIAYFDIDFTCARAKELFLQTSKKQIDLLARAPSINTAGIINFYLDFVFLRDFIREQQQLMQRLF